MKLPGLGSPLVFVAVGLLLWSTQAVVTKRLVENSGALTTAFWTFLFAAVASLAIAQFTGSLRKAAAFRLPELSSLAIIAVFWTFSSVLYYSAFTVLSSAQAVSVRYLWPVFLVLAGFLVLTERPTARQWLGVLLGFLAVYLLAGRGALVSFHDASTEAVFIVLASNAFWVLYLVYQKKGAFDAFASTAVLASFCTVFTFLALLATGEPLAVPSLWFIALALYFGVATVSLGNAVYSYGLSRLSTAPVSAISYFTPFLALAWSMLFLGEEIYSHYVLGLAVAALAAFLGSPRKAPGKAVPGSDPAPDRAAAGQK